MKLVVYVPREGTQADRTIAPGSAIVGTADPHLGLVTIDYEGNLYGMQNLEKFTERLKHAAGRHVTKYPTTARMTVPCEDLVPVGYFDTETGEVEWLDGVCQITGTWWYESPNLQA